MIIRSWGLVPGLRLTGSRRGVAADTDRQAGTKDEKQRDERAPLSEAIGAVRRQIDLWLFAGDARRNQLPGDGPKRQAQMLMTERVEHRPAVWRSANNGQ